MVDTVLSRDKNWARWKAENCPPIERAPISAEQYLNAQSSAQKACTNKRLRSQPLGSLDLRFLSDKESITGLERLTDKERYQVPTVESFMQPIENDQLDMDMAMRDEDKRLSMEAKASKTWRALRIASKSKLNLFDKIEDGRNLGILLKPPEEVKAAADRDKEKGTPVVEDIGEKEKGEKETKGEDDVLKKDAVTEEEGPSASKAEDPPVEVTITEES